MTVERRGGGAHSRQAPYGGRFVDGVINLVAGTGPKVGQHHFAILPLRAVRNQLNLRVIWLRDLDLNQGPSGYEPDELPGCSTPRRLCYVGGYCCLMVFFDGVFWRGFLLDRLDDLAATYSPVP
jgi:hypothetical protein